MTNPWLPRRVLNYAHQGGAKEAPSSTLLAIEQALAAGADAIELDVHATRDGELVVCHDATVDATSNGTGAIADLTLDELLTLDNGYRFEEPAGSFPFRGRAPADPRLRVVRLREVLETYPDVFLNLDIKQTAPEVVPYEAALAQLLRDHGRADDVIVASFLDHATDAFSAVAPEINTSAGTLATAAFYFALRDGTEVPPMRHVALQVPVEAAGVELVTEIFVAGAHAAGLAVHVWTIDDEPEMHRLLDLGVDGIITDRPSRLEAVLQRRHLAWP